MHGRTTTISQRHATARRQRSLLAEALLLGERCERALEDGDVDRLDATLEERASLLSCIAEQADLIASTARGNDDADLQADLDAIDELAARIVAMDETLAARLVERRDRCATELGGLAAAGRAAAAYGFAPASSRTVAPREEDRRA